MNNSKAFGWLLPVLLAAVVVVALVWPTTFALPPYLVLQVIFRYVTYPLLTGEHSAQALPHPPGIYFLVLTPVALALLAALYRYLSRRPSGKYLGRAASAFGLLVLAMYALNAKVQGGLGIPLALAYSAGLLGLCWEAQRTGWARRLLAALAWTGLGFFVSSGAVIAITHGEARFDLQRLHGVYGYLWIAAMGAYLIAHITEYEAKRETSSRNWGYAASAILTAAALTGVARLHGGGETVASGLWPHVVTGVAAIGAIVVHVGASWRKRGLRARPVPSTFPGPLVIVCLCLGVVLPALPFARSIAGGKVPTSAATPASLPAVDVARAASPDAAVRAGERAPAAAHAGSANAAQAAVATLPAEVLSVRESPLSCGKTGGCHVDAQAQWERSAHRHSANAAYRKTVSLLIEERGIEAAQLCAGCHDPVPLLTGRIAADSGYPFADSEGVTCVVCHSMQPGPSAKNGDYAITPSPAFHGTIKDPFTSYMMVELYRDEHRADLLPATLTGNDMCASCHNLTTEHLVLRRTFDEWSEGPFGPRGTNTKPCTACHMPLVGDSYLGFFELHDHRMPAANVALAPLRGESAETERKFIADALDLDASIERAARGFELVARLENRGGAHVFPTAPRDLLDYWFEVRFEGEGMTAEWLRVDEGGLFPETLVDRAGETLLRHEIWRAVEHRGPEGIPPGEAHEYRYPLPSAPARTERASVRLMHRRYRDAFLAFLGGDSASLETEAVEILARTIEWPPNERVAASR